MKFSLIPSSAFWARLFMHKDAPPAVNPLVKVCLTAIRGLLYLLVLVPFALGATKAEQLAEQAKKAERNGQLVQAYILYAQAAAEEPTNFTYWERAQALRPAADLLDTSVSKLPDLKGVKTDPTLFGPISDADLDQARRPLPPTILKISPEPRDYDLRGDSTSLWEQVAATLHLRVIFDPEYRPTAPIHFELSSADYKVALRALEAATNSFLNPISSDLIFVANDTTEKRNAFERTAAVVIPFPEGESVQELQEIATGVRGLLDSQKLMVDTTRHLILIRDRVTKIRLAEMVLEDLLRPRAQVAVDVEVVNADISSSLNYGLSLPTAFPLVNFPSKSNLLNIIPSGFSNFAAFGGGASLIGLGITSAKMFATVAKSNTETLLQGEVVASDGQAATLHVGERYPIVTNSYIGSNGTNGTTRPTSGGTTNPTTPTSGTGAGTLQLGQGGVTWTYQTNGALPEAASISVTSTAGTIDYSASVVSSSSWLVVNNQNTAAGTLPATLTISAGPALGGLGTGTYTGVVQVSGSDGSVAYITMNLTVNGGSQTFTFSPSSVTLASAASGFEVQEVVSVNSTENGTLTATVNGPGLSATASETTATAGTPATVTVIGNPTGLSARSYVGVLSVAVAGVTQEIQVTFNVVSGGSLQLSQTSVPWSYMSGGSLPTSLNVTVTSSSPSVTYTATASSANSWLTVNGETTVTGSLPATLTIAPTDNLAGLATGTYTGSVQVHGTDGSLAYFNVNLTVNGGKATGLAVSPNPITLNAPLGGAAVEQTITVTSAVAGTLAATVSGSGLSLTLPNTTIAANTPVTFTLNANPSGLAAQNYVGYLSVNVGSITQTVQITFSVGAVNSGTNGATIYTPPPTFSFEDLGLVLKMTPHVLGAEEVSLDVDAEFKLLSGASNEGIPIILNTTYQSKVTLEAGEWAVLAGLMTSTEARSISGIPLLSAVPFLRNNTVTRDNGQTLIVLKPHIVIQPPSESTTWKAWSGTETRLPTEF